MGYFLLWQANRSLPPYLLFIYMNWEIIFVSILLIGALVSFILERLPTDVTALLVFALLIIAGSLPFAEGLPPMDELINVFANPAPLAIAALFILSAAMEKCGLIEQIASILGGVTKLGYTRLLLVMILLVAFISAFINNTPVVVIFLPVILSLSRKVGTAASKLLIPLSYASIFGGVCTLVGTSTNILASSIIESSGQPPISMFELTKVGVPLLILGTIYLLLFGRKLLPHRESLTSILSEEERKEYFTEAFVRPNSDLVGKTINESGLLKSSGVRILEIIRNEVALHVDLKSIPLEAGDRLILACRPSGFAHARSVEGLRLGVEEREGLETISAHEGSIVEGVIGPRSSIVGKTIKELNFRQRFRMIILAIHRNGINLRDKIEHLPLEFGDTILMMGTDEAREQIRRGDDILLLDRPPTPTRSVRSKAPIVLITMVGLITVVSFNLMSITAAALVGAGIVLGARVLSPKEGYASIDWSILVLIYGMLALGQAMESTGVSKLIAMNLVSGVENYIPAAWQSLVMLACVYLITSIFTETLSNNATVVLMAPIALNLAATMGVDPRPFIIATCIACSASFSTPIGYQTNTYVYSVGGYRFRDFIKVGIPLNFVYFIGTVLLVPFLWEF